MSEGSTWCGQMVVLVVIILVACCWILFLVQGGSPSAGLKIEAMGGRPAGPEDEAEQVTKESAPESVPESAKPAKPVKPATPATLASLSPDTTMTIRRALLTNDTDTQIVRLANN